VKQSEEDAREGKEQKEETTHPSLEVTRTQNLPRIVVGELVRALDAVKREDLPRLVAFQLGGKVGDSATEAERVAVRPRTDEETVRDGDGTTLKRCFVGVRDGAALFKADGAVGETGVVRATEDVGGGGTELKVVEKSDVRFNGFGLAFVLLGGMTRRFSMSDVDEEKGSLPRSRGGSRCSTTF
jgi:hypothetical protein